MEIRAITNNHNNITHKGSVSTTENGAKYYKANNGLKVGAIYGGISVISSLFDKKMIVPSILFFGASSGIGAYIDYKRNKKAIEAADYIQNNNEKDAIKNREDIYLSTKTGKPYYKSNVGAKYGTAIGAILGAIIGIIPGAALSVFGLIKLKNSKFALNGLLLVPAISALYAFGGFILGKITDYFTNKNAEKNA